MLTELSVLVLMMLLLELNARTFSVPSNVSLKRTKESVAVSCLREFKGRRWVGVIWFWQEGKSAKAKCDRGSQQVFTATREGWPVRRVLAGRHGGFFQGHEIEEGVQWPGRGCITESGKRTR